MVRRRRCADATESRRSAWAVRGHGTDRGRRRDEWRRLQKDDKAWPVENWVALIRNVLGTLPDARVVLCGAPQEGEMLRAISGNVASPDVVAAEEIVLRDAHLSVRSSG